MEQKKKDYSFLGNIAYMLRQTAQVSSLALPITVLQVPVLAAIPILTAYLSREVVALIGGGAEVATLLGIIGGIAAALLVLNLLNNFLELRIQWYSSCLRYGFIVKNNLKVMDADFQNIEGPEAKIMMRNAERAVFYTHSSTTGHILRMIVALFSNTVGIIMYSAILFTVSPWIVPVLVILGFANYKAMSSNLRWWRNKRENWIKEERKLEYLHSKLTSFDSSKDIRLYKMMHWLKIVYNNSIQTVIHWMKAEIKRALSTGTLAAVLAFVRDGTAYVLLLLQVFEQNMSPSDFVFYFTLISQYSTWTNGFFEVILELKRAQIQISDLRTFLDLPDSSNRGQGRQLPKSAPEIRFENVYFKYDGADDYTLKKISFTIGAGEKIALVGVNGAGKTTIVKLLCGFYTATEGTIYIDNHPIGDYNRDQLFSLFSAVFQDVYLLPMSIGANITLKVKSEVDERRLSEVIKLADFEDKINALPKRLDTILLKTVNDEAVELSGGEKQKLALARALYKGGNIIVLDEPTAALDPIAESKQYGKYAELTQGTTSLYISHRLASTRFCDRILFLENGEIVEHGTHDSLIAKGGSYANMFSVQSQYYQEGGVAL